jgi:hypothetical protein
MAITPSCFAVRCVAIRLSPRFRASALPLDEKGRSLGRAEDDRRLMSLLPRAEMPPLNWDMSVSFSGAAD